MMPDNAGKPSRNPWFEERRHLFVKNMFKDFCTTYRLFLALAKNYAASHHLAFAEIDQLVGTETNKGHLWHLKDRCHDLWRDSDMQTDPSGSLLDWVIGSIFHEAMKLKENTYMLQYYGPLAEVMKQRSASHSVKFCGDECQRFMERTTEEIGRQMESLGFMFNRASLLVRGLVIEQAGNGLLIRHLLENPTLATELWAERLEELLAEMFPDGAEYGYCAAARSYLEGDWCREALSAYQKALAINPDCEEAQRQRYQLETLLRHHPHTEYA